jgi:hypothetical protein
MFWCLAGPGVGWPPSGRDRNAEERPGTNPQGPRAHAAAARAQLHAGPRRGRRRARAPGTGRRSRAAGPYPDEDGVVGEELGWRVLPADATPAQRARAEAVWRAVRPDWPCRCSGPCLHRRACGDDEQGDGPYRGLLIHVDRFPGSLFSLVAWNDVYHCADCGEQFDAGIMLEAIPWAPHPRHPDVRPVVVRLRIGDVRRREQPTLRQPCTSL